MNGLKEIVFIIFLLLTQISFGQNGKVSGRVVDKKTEKPIAFANVFINNSSVGTVTDATGAFTIANLNQPAVFEVVISFVGYESAKFKISVTDFEVKLGTIFLKDSDASLNEVTIHSKKDTKWEKKLKRFKKAFLGGNEFSKGCIILNPWVINFSEDEKDKALVASSDSPIEIENKMLGYKVLFYLTEFKSKGEDYLILGNTRFDELHSANQKEQVKWENNRKKAYHLSLQHLFKSMIDQRIYHEGFSLNKVTSAGLSSDTPYDTLTLVSPTSQPGVYMISFKGPIEVVYEKRGVLNTSATSGWIELKKDFILVNREGFEINPTGVVTFGEFNDARVASLLPINYQPENLKRNQIKENTFPIMSLIEKIYIHTDKPYYYPGETLWFKGYMNYTERTLRVSLSKPLYIELIEPRKKKIVLSQIVKIDSGVFSGDFVIPDTLKADTYYLRAYTNLNRNFGDDRLYTKPIPVLFFMDRVDPYQNNLYNQKKSNELSIATNKREYKPREKIVLTLQTLSEGDPISANLSVSVTDAEQIIPVTEESDIVGSYPIDEMPEPRNANQVFQIEYGINFSGQFFNDSGKPKKNTLNIIQIDSKNLFQVETDDLGIFTLKDLNFSDTSLFAFKPEVKSSKPSGKVVLLNRNIPSINLPEQKIKLKILRTDSLQRVVKYDSLGKDSKLLNEVVVKGKKINTPIQVGSSSVYVIEGSEIKGGNIFNNLVQIPRLRVILGEGRIFFIERLSPNGDTGPEPDVYIDGILRTNPGTSAIDALYSVNTNSILYVTVSDGAISITTKPIWWDDRPKFQVIKLKGYSVPSEFKNIDYSDSAKSKNSARDVRSTIYWNPFVITSTQSGKSTLSFYSADLLGRYRIVVEGVTKEGNPVRSESYIKVDDE